MTDDTPRLSDARAQEIAERAAARALNDTFRLLGVDINELDDVNELRDDFRFIRRQRCNSENRRNEAGRSAVTALVGGFIGMLLSAVTWILTIMRHPQ